MSAIKQKALVKEYVDRIGIVSNATSLEQFRENPRAIHYYTGFDDYEHVMFIFHILEPAAYELKYRSHALSPEDHLFLTLVKLRQNKGRH